MHMGITDTKNLCRAEHHVRVAAKQINTEAVAFHVAEAGKPFAHLGIVQESRGMGTG